MKTFIKTFYVCSIVIFVYTVILFFIGSYEIDYFDGALRILSRVYISKGYVPYKDFSVVYPPGMFFIFGKIIPYYSNMQLNIYIGLFYILFFLLTSYITWKIRSENNTKLISLAIITLYFSFVIRIFGHSDAISLIFPAIAVIIYIYNPTIPNKYVNFINMFIFSISVWFRWEWMFMLLIFEVVIVFISIFINEYKIIKFNSESYSVNQSSMTKFTISSALGYFTGWFLLIYYFNTNNVTERALDFIINIPISLTGSYRDLPLPIPKHPFRPESILYFSLIFIIILSLKSFFYFKKQKQNINANDFAKIVLSLSGFLVFIFYALGRSDWPHFVPLWFYLGIIWIFLNLKYEYFNNKVLFSILILFLPLGSWYIKSSLILIPRYNFVQFQLNNQIQNCSKYVKDISAKTIFVGRLSYGQFLWNNANLYLARIDLKPATSFITEEPGIHNSCKYGERIYNELIYAEKPMVAFLNKTPQSGENESTRNMSSCGWIEKYLNENDYDMLGDCISADSQFEVRLYK